MHATQIFEKAFSTKNSLVVKGLINQVMEFLIDQVLKLNLDIIISLLAEGLISEAQYTRFLRGLFYLPVGCLLPSISNGNQYVAWLYQMVTNTIISACSAAPLTQKCACLKCVHDNTQTSFPGTVKKIKRSLQTSA